MLEKQIEHAVCEYARARDVLAYKFTSPNRMAVPDRLFILPSGKMFFCEFKRTGAKPTEAQEREHLRLRQHNVNVFVIDNVEDGKMMINLMLDMMTMGSA
jgi:hypothetical protein